MFKFKPVMNESANWIKKFLATPLYPVVLGWYTVLFLYLHNIDELTIGVLGLPLLVAVAAISMVLGSLYLLFRNWHKAAMLSVMLTVFFYFYSPIFLFFSGILTDLGITARHGWIVVGGMGLVLMAVAWQLRRSQVQLRKLTLIANGMTLLLLGVTVIQIVPQEWQRLASDHQGVKMDAWQSVLDTGSSAPQSELPDVYYLIFDKYASNQSLKDYYGLDNSGLHQELRQRGFYVADQSRTNYPSTIFSLSSSLNVSYIQDIVDLKDPSISTGTTLKWLLSNNSVGKLFQQKGYTYYHLGNWYDLTRRMEGADVNLLLEDEARQQNFMAELLGQSLYARLANPNAKAGIDAASTSMSQRQIIEYQLEAIRDIPAVDEPTFTVAHILLPHDPYVYDAACNPITLMDVSLSRPKQYTDHIQCANTLLLHLVDDILAKSEEPPIIIFQSDEGSRPYNGDVYEKDLYDFAEATDDYLLERTGIQNAYYFPDQDYHRLYPDISPVNSFRLVLSQYLGYSFELTEDRHYVFPDRPHMFDFFDATGRIQQAESGRLKAED